MNVLKTLTLVSMMTVLGACGLLNEKNQGALASTYATLYAFFETAAPGSVGCFPNANDNTNYSPDNTLKAVYSFQIERPSTLVVCAKDTTTYDTPLAKTTMEATLNGQTISFEASNTKVNPGSPDLVDLIRIPILGVIQNTNTTDLDTHLVGKFDMDSLTDYKYIVAVDDSCGVSVGTGMSPFSLAKQYGVTY